MKNKVLYKYFPSIDLINKKEIMIRASSRSALNDPFEVRPSTQALLEYSNSHLDKTPFRKHGLLHSINSDPSTFAITNNFPALNNYGVFCLSETRTNLLMWSHYANNHKGVVIGFDITHSFFNQDFGTPTQNHGIEVGTIHRVLYDNFRTQNFNNPTDWYLKKSDEWIYEKEHRLILPLNQSNKVLKVSVDGKVDKIYTKEEISENNDLGHPQHICLFQIPKEAISSITFGANYDRFTWLGRKVNAPKEGYWHENIKFEKSEISADRFEIEITDWKNWINSKIRR